MQCSIFVNKTAKPSPFRMRITFIPFFFLTDMDKGISKYEIQQKIWVSVTLIYFLYVSTTPSQKTAVLNWLELSPNTQYLTSKHRNLK